MQDSANHNPAAQHRDGQSPASPQPILPLDYARPSASGWHRPWLFFWAFLIVTPVALLATAFDPILSKRIVGMLLFPYGSLLDFVHGPPDLPSNAFIFQMSLVCLQFPTYGLLLSLAARRGKRGDVSTMAIVLAAAHAVAVSVCLLMGWSR